MVTRIRRRCGGELWDGRSPNWRRRLVNRLHGNCSRGHGGRILPEHMWSSWCGNSFTVSGGWSTRKLQTGGILVGSVLAVLIIIHVDKVTGAPSGWGRSYSEAARRGGDDVTKDITDGTAAVGPGGGER